MFSYIFVVICRKYDDADEYPEGIASPTGSNDILPPHVISPTNQTSHGKPVAMKTTTSAIPISQGFPVPQHRYNSNTSGLTESKVTTNARQSHVAAIPSHRKNSIEMFLSQSPSQSLGGDFLKLTLDDHNMSLERGPGSGGVVGGNAFASGHFALNPVPESPKKFIRSNSSNHIRNHHQQQELQPPPMMSRSSSASSYNNYQLSPRMGSEDSWHGSQDGGQQSSAAYYQEHASQEYYGGNGQSLQYDNPRSREQQQQRQQDHGMYRNSQSSYGGGGGYGGNGRNQMNSGGGQWNPNIVSSGGAAYNANGMYMNAPHASQMQQQQMQYQQQGASLGMRGNSGSRGRQNIGNNHGYSRMTPPLPEASPPHSPRKSMHMGLGSSMGMTKQCKFFLQGHCRMGSKCKFAHQPVQNQHLQMPQHSNSSNGLGGRSDSGLYQQQQQLQMSPPHLHQGGLQGGGDEYSHSFARQQQSRSAYRQADLGSLSGMSSGGSSLNGGLGGGSQTGSGGLGGISAPGLIVAAADASGLSAALSVEDIQGRVFAMSKDQNGCRLLQEQLDYEDRQDLCEVIYQESLDHLAEMMVDPFGNYLFQKLLERVAEKKRLAIIRRVSSNLVAAALNLHGTRSVQKVVEVCATSSEVIEDDNSLDDDLDSDAGRRRDMNSGVRRTVNLPDIIVEALKDDAVRLCIDSNGNHVIQRALQFMKPEYNQFVFDAVCKECTTVGTHRHGCCVLQRCLDAANKQQKAEVIAQVEKQAMKLMQDPYGNYVVQYVLDSCTAEEAYGVIVKPLGNIFELSIQKFSSNVIEKCLEKAPERVRQNYIKEIINCPKMNKMLQDQFANYVVQRALCVCSEEQCLQLVKSIRPHLACMKNTSGGRRITARILKRFPNMDISMDMGLSPTSDGGMYDNNGGHLQHLSRLPPQAMGFAHQQQQYGQQQQQFSYHNTGYSNTGSGYPLAHPQSSGHHSMASHGGYSNHAHHQHRHGSSQHGGGGGLMNDVDVGSGLGMNAAGISRA